MLAKLAMRLKAISPALERAVMNRWYQAIAAWFQQPDWTFMNFGYAALDGQPTAQLSPGEEPDRYGIQLYHHVAGAAGLAGKDVLEVGSGRGGGAAWLARKYRPCSLTGMDYSINAIRLCNRLHAHPGLRFRQGNAEAMPFPDESFDVVVNVESSHGYARVDRFLGEANRVLRPGGVLAWVDFRYAAQVATLDRLFASSGFRPQHSLDITANVLRSLDLVSEQRLGLINRLAPRIVRGLLREFAAVNGSESYRALATGRMVYLSRTLQKT
jgi:SAM-dependent methyltransferase